VRLHEEPKTSRSGTRDRSGKKQVTRLTVGWPEGRRPIGEAAGGTGEERGEP
jgi:hypothetical protein